MGSEFLPSTGFAAYELLSFPNLSSFAWIAYLPVLFTEFYWLMSDIGSTILRALLLGGLSAWPIWLLFFWSLLLGWTKSKFLGVI